MDSRIALRLSKSGQTLFKSKSYQIRINGNSIGHITNEQNTLSEQLPMGKYSIEVGENDFFIKKDIELAVGQMQTITINPSCTYPLFRNLVIGLAIVTIVIQFIILDKISIPTMLIPLILLIPLWIFRKKQFGEKLFGESFALTIAKK